MMYELSPTPEKQKEALLIATSLSPSLQGITLNASLFKIKDKIFSGVLLRTTSL